MSYHPYYEPTDDGRQELEDVLVLEEIDDIWDRCINPLVADQIAIDSEAVVDIEGEILALAAYAKTKAGQADAAFIAERLVELMEPAVERAARRAVEPRLDRDPVAHIMRERANVE